MEFVDLRFNLYDGLPIVSHRVQCVKAQRIEFRHRLNSEEDLIRRTTRQSRGGEFVITHKLEQGYILALLRLEGQAEFCCGRRHE